MCGTGLTLAVRERDRRNGVDFLFWGLLVWKYFVLAVAWPAALTYALMSALLERQDEEAI